MKKNILKILVLALALSIVLSGCAGVGKQKENGIKTDDGEIIAGDNVTWPETNMGGLQKPEGKITAVVKDDKTGNYTATFSDMSAKNAAQYVAQLKKLGYQAIMEVNDADGVMFSGKNSSGVMVTFTYNSTAKEGSVSYVPSPSEGSGSAGNPSVSQSNIDMSDISPWPNFLPGVPELKGKIVNALNQNDETATVELEYVEKSDFEAYVSRLMQNGFTVDADETKDSYNYEYKAYNQKRDSINVSMNYEYKTATVYMEKAVAE